MNKTLAVLAASAAVALSASSVKADAVAGTDTVKYIPITITGTLTEGFQTVNSAGTKESFNTKSTAVNNKGVLGLLYSWYKLDSSPATPAIASFTTGGYQPAILWDYTTEEPAAAIVGNPTGTVTAETPTALGQAYVVVVDKTGTVVYDPNTFVPANAGMHMFTVTMPVAAGAGAAPGPFPIYTFGVPLVNSGTVNILSVAPTPVSNIYNPLQGSGSLNYTYKGGFDITDTTSATVVPSTLADSTLSASGKGTGSATFGANGVETKVGFSFDSFGAFQEYLDTTTLGTSSATIDLKITAGVVTVSSSGPSNQPF